MNRYSYDDDEDDFDEIVEDDDYDDDEDEIQFKDPGGRSSLRAASATNPRNLPCPSCGEQNRLTPADQAEGYQCDECADRVERGYD